MYSRSMFSKEYISQLLTLGTTVFKLDFNRLISIGKVFQINQFLESLTSQTVDFNSDEYLSNLTDLNNF